MFVRLATDLSYKALLKSLVPLNVQHPLPTIGVELYPLGVHMRAKKMVNKV